MGVVKTWNGIVRASLKTFNGIAMASVKTINGFDATVTSGCTTVYDENASAVSDSIQIGHNSGTYFVGQIQYAAPSTDDICAAEFVLTATGDITGFTYTAYIYTEGNPISPGSPLATSTGIAGDNAWSTTSVKFSFPSPYTFTASTQYFICVSTNAAADASNYARMHRTAAGGISGLSGWFTSAGNRTSFSTSDIKLKLYTS